MIYLLRESRITSGELLPVAHAADWHDALTMLRYHLKARRWIIRRDGNDIDVIMLEGRAWAAKHAETKH